MVITPSAQHSCTPHCTLADIMFDLCKKGQHKRLLAEQHVRMLKLCLKWTQSYSYSYSSVYRAGSRFERSFICI